MVVDLTQLLQLTVNGLVVGSVLALAAVGLTLVYGILDLANFAHGDLVTLGAYLGLYFVGLLALSATVTWAITLAAVLLILVVLDRWLRPKLSGIWDRIKATPSLSRTERHGTTYLAIVLVAMGIGVTVGPAVPTGIGTLAAVTLAVAGILTQGWSIIRTSGGRLGPRLGISLALVPVVAAVLVLAVGPVIGWTVGWAGGLAVGLLVPAGATLQARPDVLSGRWTTAGLALAGLVAAVLLTGDLVLATALTLLLVGGFTMVLDGLIWRPMRGRDAGLLTLIIISIGLALAVRNGIIIKWGTGVVDYPGASRAPLQLLEGVLVTRAQLVVIGVTLACILLVHVILRHTKIGKAMRALADDVDLARITGIDVDRVILYVWFIAGALAALAGILLATIRPFTTSLGWFLLLPIFAAVILGGIGSAYGAMAGGYVIGIGMETSLAFGVPPDYRLAVGFAIMILVLIVRPQGIFGGQATR